MHVYPFIWNTASFTGGGGGDGFGIIQTPYGTSPAADMAADTLTFTSVDGSLSIVGDASSDTIDFSVLSGGGAVPDYIIQKDEASSTVVYFGYALPGTLTSVASWKIKRLTDLGGNDFKVEYADGNANFDNIWDNRVSLSYS